VTDEHDAAPETPEPAAPAEQEREDGRRRPPDPAGTRPQWDPDTLVPPKGYTPAAPTLWAPPRPGDGEQAGGDREVVGAAAGAHAAPAPAATAAGHSRYSPRFQFLLGALIAVGASAIVLLVAVLVGQSGDKPAAVNAGPAWSPWRPLSEGVAGAQQIADHVGHEYRLPSGKQLVGVTGGPMEIGNVPVTVALRQSAAQGGDIKFFDGGVLYRLCGLGKRCAIDTGKPTPNRHLLLRREALELALYSFRYLGVSEAVVMMPPGTITRKVGGKVKTQRSTTSLFFRRGDRSVSTAVTRPLDATLVPKTPTVSGVTRSPDARFVNALTNANLFNSKVQLANQDARAFLVLDPLTGP
jgi:hypothetical protein